ncbi:Discoidin domain-containing receptor 2 [Gryllus bimaculatus]|nr:Discoidin domain-containing receptor 2 [Gryllus bimaculatus]
MSQEVARSGVKPSWIPSPEEEGLPVASGRSSPPVASPCPCSGAGPAPLSPKAKRRGAVDGPSHPCGLDGLGRHSGTVKLCHDRHGGAWCPRNMVTLEAREYLQVDLGAMHAVTAVQTQGRFGNGMGQEYAEAYMLEYWRPGLDRWLRWRDRRAKELLQGNSNTYTVVEQRLEPPVLASRVRFVPYSEHLRTVCMRVELLGCRWTEGLLSYAMPQGAQRGPGLDLRDRLYDGRDEGGRLSGGLGQLSDGRRGADLFRLDQQAHAKGSEWVGWRNDSAALLGRPVEITFEFDHVRNFSAMFLHTSNLYSKDVQVFSHAKVYFSVSGRQYSPEPVFFSYMADLALEHARNVTIKLHGRGYN